MASRQKIASILKKLEKAYPKAKIALVHRSPFELLVATILSAQCTDVRVNLVTPSFFKRFPTPDALAKAQPSEVETLIHSTGFFRNKAKSLIGMAQMLVAKHHSQVPNQMDALLKLPGVARKTANVIMGTAFGLASGVVVDTHVLRISRLLGLSNEKTADKVERDLMQWIPKKHWIMFSHRLIWHGRQVCIARRPKCDVCVLKSLCPSSQ